MSNPQHVYRSIYAGVHASYWHLPGDHVNAESWVLRNHVYLFSRATKRGHRPREQEFQQLMIAAGIPVPDTPHTGSRSNSSLDGMIGKFLFQFS